MGKHLPWMDCPDGIIRADIGAFGKCDGTTPYVKTAAYTITQADTGKVFSNKGAAGSVTFTLPTAKAGLVYRFLKPTAQAIVFGRSAGVKVNGADADLTVAAGFIGIVEVTSDGTEWFVRTSPDSVDLDVIEKGADAQLIIGQTDAAPAYKDVTGDVTITKEGVTAIGAGKVTSAMMSETLIREAAVALTNAQIKGLRGAPITAVAAPGAGKALEFVSCTLFLDYGSNALTRPNNDENIVLRYENGSGALASEPTTATFPTQTADAMTVLNAAASTVVAKTVCENKALVFHNVGSGEIGGNAGNDTVIRAKVRYRTHVTGW